MSIVVEAPARALLYRRLELSDRAAVGAMLEDLSPTTRFRRFLTPIPRITESHLDQLVAVDHADRRALGCFEGEELVGLAHCYTCPDAVATAEIAIVVADRWQRRGIGSELVSRLLDLARAGGLRRVLVTAHADNVGALLLLRRAFPGARLAISGGIVEGSAEVVA